MNQVSSIKDQVSSERKVNDLLERFTVFSEQIIAFSRGLKADHISRPIISQLIRSATSIAANYAESQNASSRKDFTNKIIISKKEAQESSYWLRMLKRCFPEHKENLAALVKESGEITLILQSIVNKMREL
jgi:four helix bundle protein